MVENVVQDWGSCGDPGNPAGTPLVGFVLPSLLLGALIIDEMAAASAAVKFGSEAMAAVTVSTIEVWLWRWPNTCGAGSLGGKYIGCPSSCGGTPCNGKGNVAEGDGIRCNNCMGLQLGLCVKSSVIVGNGAEADRVAMVDT